MWSQRFGDPQNQTIYGLVVGASSDVYIGGTFTGTIDPGNGPLISAGGEDVFLVRLNANGTAGWARRFGDPGYQAMFGLAIASRILEWRGLAGMRPWRRIRRRRSQQPPARAPGRT